MPWETGRSWRVKGMSLPLAEAVGDQLLDRLQGFVFLLALGVDGDRAALGCGQHHHAHDALGVDAAAVALEPDLARKSAGELGELGRGACMQPELVDDGGVSSRHSAAVSVFLYVWSLQGGRSVVGDVQHAVAGPGDGALDEG